MPPLPDTIAGVIRQAGYIEPAFVSPLRQQLGQISNFIVRPETRPIFSLPTTPHSLNHISAGRVTGTLSIGAVRVHAENMRRTIQVDAETMQQVLNGSVRSMSVGMTVPRQDGWLEQYHREIIEPAQESFRQEIMGSFQEGPAEEPPVVNIAESMFHPRFRMNPRVRVPDFVISPNPRIAISSVGRDAITVTDLSPEVVAQQADLYLATRRRTSWEMILDEDGMLEVPPPEGYKLLPLRWIQSRNRSCRAACRSLLSGGKLSGVSRLWISIGPSPS